MKKIRKLLVLLVVLCMAVTLTACDSGDYKAAVKLLESGDYKAASDAFKALGGYEDSALLAKSCDYKLAVSLMGSEKYEEAIDAFTALGDYKDSAELIKECNYKLAMGLLNEEKYEEAIEAFAALGDYADSQEYLRTAQSDLIGAKVVGKWVSDELDVSDYFRSSIDATVGNNPDAQALLQYLDTSFYSVKISLEFTDKGTVSLSMDEELLHKNTVTLGEKFMEATYRYFLDVLSQAFASEGYTLDQAKAELGVSSDQELVDMMVESSLGISLSDYVDAVMPLDQIEASSKQPVNGTYTLDGMDIFITLGTDSDVFRYDPDTDTIIGSYDEMEAENVLFTRA